MINRSLRWAVFLSVTLPCFAVLLLFHVIGTAGWALDRFCSILYDMDTPSWWKSLNDWKDR